MRLTTALILSIILSCKAFSIGNSTPTLPSHVLDLSNWKITLPIDLNSDGNPDEIKQPSFATYSHSEYFHLNAQNNGVVFKAHAGGFTTTNSGYPRSELREMTNNGTANASWGSNDGLYHILEVKEKITHYPDVKKHVVVAQIHDAVDDVVMLRLETSKLFLEFQGVDGPTLTSSYVLGTEFTFKMIVHDNQIEFYYNGNLIHTQTYTTAFSGAYFKAGMYTQSSCQGSKKVTNELCSAYGEMELLGLSTYHGSTLPTDETSATAKPYRINYKDESIILYEAGDSGEGTVSLFNMQGRKIFDAATYIDQERTQIDLNGFKLNGTFIILFELNGKRYHSKLIIQ